MNTTNTFVLTKKNPGRLFLMANGRQLWDFKTKEGADVTIKVEVMQKTADKEN